MKSKLYDFLLCYLIILKFSFYMYNNKHQPFPVYILFIRDVRLQLVLWGKVAFDLSEAIQFRVIIRLFVCWRLPISMAGKVNGCILSSYSFCVILINCGKLWNIFQLLWLDDRIVCNAYNVSALAINPSMSEVEGFLSL